MTTSTIEGFHLSPQQKRQWDCRSGERWRAAWVLVRSGIQLTAEAVEGGLKRLAARHEMLRTKYVEIPGLAFPLQAISTPEIAVGQEFVGTAELDKRATAAACELERQFASRGAFVAACVWNDEQGASHLWFAGPRLSFDTESLLGLCCELAEGLTTGRYATEQPLQYADYAQWHRDLLEDASGQREHLEFWRRIARRNNREMGPSQTAGAGYARALQAAALGPQLRAVAEELRVSVAALLGAGWASVYARFRRESELQFGYRREQRVQSVLADCVGPLDVRLPAHWKMEPEHDLRQAAQSFEDTLQAAYEAADWVWAIEEVNREPTPVGLSCVVDRLQTAAAGWRLEHFGGVTASALELCCIVGDESVGLQLEYQRGEIDAGQANSLVRCMKVFLAQALRSPNTLIRTVDLVSAQQARQIVEELAPGPCVARRHGCVHELFEESARRTPERAAVISGGTELTFAELDRRANRLARDLRARGLEREEPVVICCGRSVSQVEGLLGIWKAGGASVAIDIDDPDDRAIQIAFSTGARFALVDQVRRHALEACGLQLFMCSNAGWSAGATDETPPPNINQESDRLYVMYTSGSTGEPKGVEVEHGSVLNLLAALRHGVYDQHGLSPGCELRVALNAPLSFDASVKQLVLLLDGATLHVVPADVRADGARLLKFLEEQRIDVLDCTPSQLRLLDAAGMFASDQPYPSIVLVGGEPIDHALWNCMTKQTGRACYNVYGPTECTVDSTIARIRDRATAHLGRPIANARVYLLDDSLRLAPPGSVGEIAVAGAGVARGYIGRPDLTEASFVRWEPPVAGRPAERVYLTGDLARYAADGCLEYIARRDDQVKVRGVRIELGEIASAARKHPEVGDAVVVAHAQEQQLVCYVTPRDPRTQPSGAAVRGHLAASLPATMVPTHVIVVDAFPLTENGKLDRARLPVTKGLRPELGVELATPEGATELAISEIWKEVLELDVVGAMDNFFDLGGHSLLLPQVQAGIEKRLGLNFSLPQLLEFPTIRSLSQHCAERGAGARSPGETPEVNRRVGRARLADRKHATEDQLD